MTLEEAEFHCQQLIAANVRGYVEPDTLRMAHVILAMLPVVRAGEAVAPHIQMPSNGDWACEQCRPFSDILKSDFRCAQHTFLNAIDTMRTRLTGGAK